MKILVVFTGGTIGSCYNNGVISPNSSTRYKLIEMYKKNCDETEFDAISPYTVLSENLNGEYFNALYNAIKENINNYDGIIVTHGTDTLQYTSAMLSYMFGLCDTPIVLVSANYPLENEKSNGLDNFSAAVDYIKYGKSKGVFVAYKNCGEYAKIHRGSRLQKHLAYSDKVESICNLYCGEIIYNMYVKNNSYAEKQDEIKFENIPIFNATSPVLKITPYVGMVYPKLDNSIKAVLLESYHSGTINTANKDLEGLCHTANQLDIPVFLTGSEAGFFYESKELYSKLGIQVLPPVAPISAYIKLWLLCENDTKDIFNSFSKSVGGDIFISEQKF